MYYVIRRKKKGGLTVTEHKSLPSAHSEWAKTDPTERPIIVTELDFTHPGDILDFGDRVQVLGDHYDLSPPIKNGTIGKISGFVRGQTSARLFLEVTFDLPYVDANGKLWPITDKDTNFVDYFFPFEVAKVSDKEDKPNGKSKSEQSKRQ